MKKNKNSKKLVLKHWVRITLICILVLMLIVSLYIIYRGKNPKNNDIPKYHYDVSSNIDYKVYLLPNNFYEEEYLPMDKQYATSLINYIDIDFKYLYNGSLQTNMNYTYDITADVIGEYENENGKSEIWKKSYNILEKQNQNLGERTTFDINQNIKIDYRKYNKIVEDFKKNIKLAIDAYLDIKLNVNYNNGLQTYNSNIKGKNVLEIKIPLDSDTIQIDTDYVKNKKKVLNAGDLNAVNKSQIRIGIFMLVLTLVLTILASPKLFISNKNIYLKELKKIMKNYSEIIVEVENEFDFENLEILDLKTFEDMVDVEEELKLPILYYEIEENAESWFVIVSDKYLYRYILTK